MIKKKIKAIIWDLDGTLIDFRINSIEARRKALKLLKAYGIPRNSISIQKSIIENVKIARGLFEQNGVPPNEVLKIIAEVNKVVIEVEHKAALKATLTKDIDKVLEFLKSNNIKQAIFTFNTHANALLSLKTANIDKYFDVIIGRDDTENLKPHPDHVRKICEQLMLGFDEIVIIGDTNTDIEAAINIGSYCIALKTKIPNYIKRNAFEKATIVLELKDIPNALITTLKELI